MSDFEYQILGVRMSRNSRTTGISKLKFVYNDYTNTANPKTLTTPNLTLADHHNAQK